MELLELLNNPFDGLSKNEDIQGRCLVIARDLFRNYCINCNNEEFYFAEIEIYYFKSKDEEFLKREDNDWEGVTYPRITEAGDLFYHLSGCDICFKSNLIKTKSELKGEGGGILIRSLVDKNNKVTAGPINCVNKMINACGKGGAPFLSKIGEERNQVEVKPTYRFLGGSDFKKIDKKENNDGKLKLAFYDEKIASKDWNNARPSYYSYRFKHELH